MDGDVGCHGVPNGYERGKILHWVSLSAIKIWGTCLKAQSDQQQFSYLYGWAGIVFFWWKDPRFITKRKKWITSYEKQNNFF
jgi:hypothetical protein